VLGRYFYSLSLSACKNLLFGCLFCLFVAVYYLGCIIWRYYSNTRQHLVEWFQFRNTPKVYHFYSLYFSTFSNIFSSISDALRFFGWCPQFDALIGLLTAREQLTMYARIKGLNEDIIPDTVSAFLNMLDLTQYAERPVAGYPPDKTKI
jgi:hypothetical protein